MRRLFPLVAVLLPILFLSCPKEPGTDSSDLITLDLRGSMPQQGATVNVPADFAGMGHGGYYQDYEREYAMLAEMNVVWLHRDFSWSGIEPSEGNFNWTNYDLYVQRAQDAGKKVMAMLLYDVGWVHTKHGNPSSARKIWPNEIPDFCNYVEKTVERYNGLNGHGKVDIWIIWNEPDLAPRFWTVYDPSKPVYDPNNYNRYDHDPNAITDFFALTKAAAETIRDLDRKNGTTTLLAGGAFTALVSDAWVKGFLEYENGAIKDLLDGIAFHPYSPNPVSAMYVVDDFKSRVAPYGFADKIWLNEMGYPTYSEKGVIPDGRYGTDQYEGDMPEVVTKTFVLMAALGVRNITWYHLFDGPNREINDSEDWFGLVWLKNEQDWIKKGGYWAYALSAQHLPGKSCHKLSVSGSEDIQAYYFQGDDGRRTLLVWNNSPLDTLKVNFSFNGTNHQLWNVETGEATSINASSTHTVYPINTYQKTLLFFTWQE